MSARQQLAAAFFSALCLERHEMGEQPNGPAQTVGFVELPGAERLKPARWRNGEWLTAKLKPFPERPLCWYSVEVRRNG